MGQSKLQNQFKELLDAKAKFLEIDNGLPDKRTLEVLKNKILKFEVTGKLINDSLIRDGNKWPKYSSGRKKAEGDCQCSIYSHSITPEECNVTLKTFSEEEIEDYATSHRFIEDGKFFLTSLDKIFLQIKEHKRSLL